MTQAKTLPPARSKSAKGRAAQIDWDLPRADFRNQSEFDPAFIADLRGAEHAVLICCPFLKPNRLEQLGGELFQLPLRGVQVCVFAQMPRLWEQRDRANAFELARIRELEIAIELLEKHGIHVNLVQGLHQKICVIDGCILWFGSLNILSYFDTKEEMMRTIDPAVALNVIKRNLMTKCQPCRAARKPVPAVETIFDVDKVGTLIAEIREKAGYTQADLAKITGLTASQISRIESSRRPATLPQLKVILNGLGREICLLAPGVVGYLEEIDFVVGEARMRTRGSGSTGV